MTEPKIIHLPTSARRKVRQPPAGERRRLAEHLDQHPAEFLFPLVRELKRKREEAQDSAADTMKDSAGLLIACSMLMLADQSLRSKIFGVVFGFHDVFRTAETHKAVLLVERMLCEERGPQGAA